MTDNPIRIRTLKSDWSFRTIVQLNGDKSCSIGGAISDPISATHLVSCEYNPDLEADWPSQPQFDSMRLISITAILLASVFATADTHPPTSQVALNVVPAPGVTNQVTNGGTINPAGTTPKAPRTGPKVVKADNCTIDYFTKKPANCSGMTIDCLAKLDSTKLPTSCLKIIPEATYKDMSSATAAKLITIPVTSMPLEKNFFLYLFKRHDWSKNNNEKFLVDLIQKKEPAELALEALGQEHEHAARLFNAFNVEQHTQLCSKLAKDMVPFITTTFFAKIKLNCFKNIPETAFEGLDTDRLAAITPENLRNIPVKCAVRIPDRSFSGMTTEQAKNWGLAFNPPDGEDKDAKQKYLDEHPCSHFKKMAMYINKPAKLALESHCKINASGTARMAEVNTAIMTGCSLAFALFFIL